MGLNCPFFIAMNIPQQNLIKESLHCDALVLKERIQDLWGGYGEIIKADVITAGIVQQVMIKHISPTSKNSHPRGWNTQKSHDRKVKSYQIEGNWYHKYANLCDNNCRVPALVKDIENDGGRFLVLEDLDAAGFNQRKSSLGIDEIMPCVEWLAHFHGKFMGRHAPDLWQTGSYWHLDTRQDEWDAMEEGPLKNHARKIDDILESCAYKTIIHGDAKVANFCFNPQNNSVAAVDFQYVGHGCGMKDLSYFMGSCLSSDDCFKHEAAILSHYFKTLETSLDNTPYSNQFNRIESEWREMYSFAWADFARFLQGWMPGHDKLKTYSQVMVDKVLNEL